MQDDEIDVEYVGMAADLPDETSIPDFLEKTQVGLARQGWELRGTCSIRSVSEATNDPVNEILFIRFPARREEFYYFNRLQSWEATDGLRETPQRTNFLELAREELAREDWEYSKFYDLASLDEAFECEEKQILIVRSPENKNKFYVFYQMEEV